MKKTDYRIKDYRTLNVVTKINALIVKIDSLSNTFPEKEKYNLESQIRRSVASIGANIAEGNGQIYPKKELNYINNALGSASETLYWAEYAAMLGYIESNKYEKLKKDIIEIQKMLWGYLKYVQKNISNHNAQLN